jgi:hypothetical protein
VPEEIEAQQVVHEEVLPWEVSNAWRSYCITSNGSGQETVPEEIEAQQVVHEETLPWGLSNAWCSFFTARRPELWHSMSAFLDPPI